ncbi:MAG: HYR domain-containing protein [Patescibacteria group bacterium]
MKKLLALSARVNFPLIMVSVLVLVAILTITGGIAPMSAEAVTTPSPCILVTGTDAKTVNLNGSSKLTATDCALTVLSASSPAVALVGSSRITASAVCAKSASITGASKIIPSIDPSCSAGNDPFAAEQEPTVGVCQYNNVSYTNSSKNTLQPGVYCGDVFLAGSTKNTLAPGVYIIKNGSFKVDGSAQVSGNDVVLFFTGNSGGLTIGGSAKVSISAPSSGTLKGFAIYIDPAANSAAQSTISGSSQVTLEGITYLPKQQLVINGSSKIVASTLATFVLKALELNGSSNFQAVGALPTGPIPDTTAPVIAQHDNVTKIGTSLGAVVTYTIPTSTDDIDGSVAVACTPTSGSTFPLGSTVVTCNSHDAAGNNATPSTFNVIVTLPPDVNAPVIAAHDDVVVAGDLSGVVVTYTKPTATDNVDPSVSVSCTPASGSLFAFGTTTVTCSAHDTAGNNAISTTFNVFVVDQVAPVIALHENISVVGTSFGVPVTYTNPTATDNVDASVSVSCAPISGSTFTAGTTTVLCNAQDAAGNVAAGTSFDVVVSVPPPVPFTMTSQSDESFLCSPDWSNCFTGGSGQASIHLGLGSTFGTGTILSATIAKDENSPFVSQPWIIQFECFTDASYTVHCSDWVQGNSWNGFRTYLVSESATSTTDNKHWTAYFTDPSHEANNDGSTPVLFKPDYYYQININDNGWNIGAYGTTTPIVVPYFTITGMTL